MDLEKKIKGITKVSEIVLKEDSNIWKGIESAYININPLKNEIKELGFQEEIFIYIKFKDEKYIAEIYTYD